MSGSVANRDSTEKEVWMGPVPILPLGWSMRERERLFAQVGDHVIRFRVDDAPKIHGKMDAYFVRWNWIDGCNWTLHYSVRDRPAQAWKDEVWRFERGLQMGVHSWKDVAQEHKRFLVVRRRCTWRGVKVEYTGPNAGRVTSVYIGPRKWQRLGVMDENDERERERWSLIFADIVSHNIAASRNTSAGT
jgi:hypothetical protein